MPGGENRPHLWKLYCWKLYCWKLYCLKNILLKIILKKIYCWKWYCWKLYCWKNCIAENYTARQNYTAENYIAENYILPKKLYCSKLYLWKRLYCWRTKNYLLKEIILFNIYALTKAPQWLISFQSFTNFSSSKTNFELPSSCFIRISCTSSNIHHVNLPTTLRDFCLSESWNALFNLMMVAD